MAASTLAALQEVLKLQFDQVDGEFAVLEHKLTTAISCTLAYWKNSIRRELEKANWEAWGKAFSGEHGKNLLSSIDPEKVWTLITEYKPDLSDKVFGQLTRDINNWVTEKLDDYFERVNNSTWKY